MYWWKLISLLLVISRIWLNLWQTLPTVDEVKWCLWRLVVLLINSSTNTILPLLINQTPQNKTTKLLIILVFFKKRKVFQPEVLLLKYLKLNSWISRNKRSLLPVNQPYHMIYPWFVLLFMRLSYHLFSTAPSV